MRASAMCEGYKTKEVIQIDDTYMSIGSDKAAKQEQNWFNNLSNAYDRSRCKNYKRMTI